MSIWKAYRDAVQVQNACNPSGIVRSLVDVIDEINADLERLGLYGTANISHHPAFVLFSSKLHDMALMGISNTRRYSLAYDFASNGNLERLETQLYRELLVRYYEEYS